MKENANGRLSSVTYHSLTSWESNRCTGSDNYEDNPSVTFTGGRLMTLHGGCWGKNGENDSKNPNVDREKLRNYYDNCCRNVRLRTTLQKGWNIFRLKSDS